MEISYLYLNGLSVAVWIDEVFAHIRQVIFSRCRAIRVEKSYYVNCRVGM